MLTCQVFHQGFLCHLMVLTLAQETEMSGRIITGWATEQLAGKLDGLALCEGITTASLAAAARAAVSSDALLLPPRDCHLAVPVC